MPPVFEYAFLRNPTIDAINAHAMQGWEVHSVTAVPCNVNVLYAFNYPITCHKDYLLRRPRRVCAPPPLPTP